MAKKDAFYIVWNPEGQNPRVRHEGWCGAAEEAKRLAIANPGQEFFVMQAHRRVTTPQPVEIEDFYTDLEVPF
ncbi:hypothetical protein [Sphingobium yanoikuyae]|jgi:hypothetical protein|uniref:hypothetical protein n=1 Tax=Sphingobium yanoikuyae TaxID=13690 RepID=UPI0035C775BE